jgi:hypothetical protein
MKIDIAVILLIISATIGTIKIKTETGYALANYIVAIGILLQYLKTLGIDIVAMLGAM